MFFYNVLLLKTAYTQQQPTDYAARCVLVSASESTADLLCKAATNGAGEKIFDLLIREGM